MKDIIIQNAQLIIGGLIGFLSSLLILVISLFAESKKLKKERDFNLNKEIYLNLQNKAEEIITGLTLLKRRVEGLKVSLDKKIKTNFEDDGLEYRLKIVSCFETFFPELNTDKYNDAVGQMHKLAEIYIKFYQGDDLTDRDIESARVYYTSFKEKINDVVNEIKNYLKENKDKIVI